LLQDQSEFEWKIEVAGTYSNPTEAIEMAQREPIQLAFLDIEMPEMNGFELAEQLLAIQPHLHIVFVTAYKDHAIKAFEMNVLDYLLKPVHTQRLTRTLQRITNTYENPVNQVSRGPMMLCCFQSLHYVDTYNKVQSFTWKTLKAPELFAYLILHRDRTVSKQILIDLLWPEYDTTRAMTQLHTAIYQIRKVLKMVELDLIIKYENEGYRLVWGHMMLDVEEWENKVRHAQAVTPQNLDKHVEIMGLYTGDLLEEHRYLWAEPRREQIRMIWLNHAKEMAACYISIGKYSDAIVLYQKICYKFPDMEEGYWGLMKIHSLLNHRNEVKKQYQLVTHKFKEEFDLTLSKDLTDWYNKWSKEG
jgi:two-component SAPR family response regulator